MSTTRDDICPFRAAFVEEVIRKRGLDLPQRWPPPRTAKLQLEVTSGSHSPTIDWRAR